MEHVYVESSLVITHCHGNNVGKIHIFTWFGCRGLTFIQTTKTLYDHNIPWPCSLSYAVVVLYVAFDAV
jgi:hypothetical protein